MVGQTIIERFEEKYIPEPNSGCWLWIGTTTWGYGLIWEGGKRNQKLLRAHRASWLIHYGPIPDGLFVLHKCDTPSCVNPTHLFLGTQKDNIQDSIDKDRHAYGGKNGQSKLTAKQVETIRFLLSFGHTHSSIAEKYGVARSTISGINTGKSWRHI